MLRNRHSLAVVCFGGLIVVLAASTLLAPPVGPADPFMADRSPKALAFREAWQAASELERHLEPLPAGVTGTQQRELVVAAMERAIAIMPEAPPCSDMLIRIGQLWNSPALAEEEPAKALEAYTRVRNEYPTNDRAVIPAIVKQSSALWLLKRPGDAAHTLEELMRYQLPDNAPPDTAQLLHTLQEEMKPHLASYRAEAARTRAAVAKQ